VSRPRNRLTVVVTAVLVPLLVLAVAAMAATWPGERRETARVIEPVEVQYPTAVVTGTAQESCQGTVEDQRPDGSIPETVTCMRVTADVTSGSQAGRSIQVWATATLTPADVGTGTRIVVEWYPATQTDDEVWAWHDFRSGRSWRSSPSPSSWSPATEEPGRCSA
jgi:hypothetical protein